MLKKIIWILLIAIAIIGIIYLTIQPQLPNELRIGNKQLFDLNNKFTYAVIYSPSGDVVKQGTVESWTDFEDGDQLQVKIDGITYLTHSSLVILSTK